MDPVGPGLAAGADGTFDGRRAGWGGEEFRGGELLRAKVPGCLGVGWEEGETGVGSWLERGGPDVGDKSGDVAFTEWWKSAYCERRCVGGGGSGSGNRREGGFEGRETGPPKRGVVFL